MLDTYFTDLTEALREECRLPTARILWDPRVLRLDGGGYGGWVIVVTAIRPGIARVDGEVVAHSREHEEVLYAFDGNHRRPLTPGRWVIHAIMEADLVRHGATRKQDVDDIREGRVDLKHESRRSAAKDMASDSEGFRAFRDAANELGYVHSSKEELVEMERRAISNLEAQSKEDLEERKMARMHSPHTNLHVNEKVKFVDINAPMGSV